MSKNEKKDTIFGCFTVMKKTHRSNQYPFTSPKWFETLSKLQERENPLIIPESLIVWSPKVPNHREATRLWGRIGLSWVVRSSWMSPSRQESHVEPEALPWPSAEKILMLSLLLRVNQGNILLEKACAFFFCITGCERHYPFVLFEPWIRALVTDLF